MLTLDLISQIGIIGFGLSAAFLVARKNKWGFVLGLASEPFWFATSIINKQWGVVALSIVYTITWTYGAYNWFIADKKKQ